MDINFKEYFDQTVDWVIRSGPRVVVILVLMFIGVRLSDVVAGRVFAFIGRRRKMDEECRNAPIRSARLLPI